MTLRSRLIRLAHDNPELRAHVLPLVKQATDQMFRDLYKALKGQRLRTKINPMTGELTVGDDVDVRERLVKEWIAGGEVGPKPTTKVFTLAVEPKGVSVFLTTIEGYPNTRELKRKKLKDSLTAEDAARFVKRSDRLIRS